MPSSCVAEELLLCWCCLWVGCIVHERSQGVGGEQVPQLSSFSLSLAAWLPGAGLSGAGAGCQGQLHSRAGVAFPSKKDRALVVPLLHPQQLAEDQPQLVSVLFGNVGHNLERHEAQGQLSGLH